MVVRVSMGGHDGVQAGRGGALAHELEKAFGLVGGVDQQLCSVVPARQQVGVVVDRADRERPDLQLVEAVQDGHRASPLHREVVAVHRAHQGEVGQRLRHVPGHAPADRVVLLGEEADVVREAGQDVEHLRRPVDVVHPGEGVGEPERACQERVLVAGHAVVGVLGAVAEQEPRCDLSSARMARTVLRMRGSSDGRNPTWASCSSDASVCVAPYDWTNVSRSASQACARTSAWIASRSVRQRSIGASSPWCSAARTARSTAAQAITFECVKCRGSPRTSQIPRSGSRQCSQQVVDEVALQRPGVVGLGDARRPAPARARTSPRRARRSASARRPRSRSGPGGSRRTPRGGRARARAAPGRRRRGT